MCQFWRFQFSIIRHFFRIDHGNVTIVLAYYFSRRVSGCIARAVDDITHLHVGATMRTLSKRCVDIETLTRIEHVPQQTCVHYFTQFCST